MPESPLFTFPTVTNPLRRPRKVCFQHVRTGRIVTAPSVAAFTRKVGLGEMGQYHFDNVLKGYRLHHSGWGRPEVLNHRLEVHDVYGNRLSSSVTNLRKHLSSYAIRRLLAGEAAGKVAPVSVSLPTRRSVRPIEYAFKRDESIVKGRTLREVAAKAGISITSACHLARGTMQRAKGVTLHKVVTERLSALPAVR